MLSLFILRLITFIQVIYNVLSLYLIIDYYDNIIIINYLTPVMMYFLQIMFDERFKGYFFRSNSVYENPNITYSALNFLVSLSVVFMLYLSNPVKIPDIILMFVIINIPITFALSLSSLLVYFKYLDDIKKSEKENISLIQNQV